MNIVLWIVQGLLSFVFTMTGFIKLTKSKDEVREQAGWVDDFTDMQLKGIGVLELLGVAGLLLPSLLKIMPELTGIAAIGLACVMAGAFYTHYRRNEVTPNGIINLVLAAMALFVAYGRLVEVPIS